MIPMATVTRLIVGLLVWRLGTQLSTGRTIGIGREFQGLFHPSSPSYSTTFTSMDIPLLIHSRLGHSNISKYRVVVPYFSSLFSIECESC